MSWFDENGISTNTSAMPVSTAGPVATAPLNSGGGTSFGFGPDVPGSISPSAGIPISSAGPVATAPLAGAPAGNLSDPSAWMALVQQGPAAVGNWLASSNPQLAQLFQQNPGLKDYYAQQIIKSPGANPTEQAGSAQYWTNKALQDPGITGQSGSTGSFGGGAQTVGGVPGIDPSYGFRFQQGLDALQRSAASRGTLLTGGTLKAINNYGQGAASQEYGADFARQMGLASLGENAAAGLGNSNSGYANSATNALTGNANAQGAAGLANANIIGGAANNVGSLYALGQLSQSGYGANAPTFPQGPAASPFQPLPGALNSVG